MFCKFLAFILSLDIFPITETNFSHSRSEQFSEQNTVTFWDGCKEVEQIEDISANVACKLADWLCILKFWHFSWKFAHDCFWHSPIFLHYCIASALSRWVLFCCGRLPKPLWPEFLNIVQKQLEAFLPFRWA